MIDGERLYNQVNRTIDSQRQFYDDAEHIRFKLHYDIIRLHVAYKKLVRKLSRQADSDTNTDKVNSEKALEYVVKTSKNRFNKISEVLERYAVNGYSDNFDEDMDELYRDLDYYTHWYENFQAR